MKRGYSAVLLVLTLILCLTFAAPALAENKTISLKIGDPYLTVDGVKQEIDPGRGTKATIVNNRTVVPIRAVIEAMGGSVDWLAPEQKVTVRYLDKTVELWIGKTTVKVNGTEVVSDTAPLIINDRTMLPARIVLENIGATVEWKDATREVIVKFDRASDSAIIRAAADRWLTAGKAATIEPKEVYEKVVVGGDKGYFLVSLQSPADYAKGHVKGAVNIPFKQIAKKENLAKLPKDKKIVLICYTGHTASYAAMFLNQLGYDAVSMKYGMDGWNSKSAGMGTVAPYTESAGYPVDTAAVTAQADNEIPAVSTGKTSADDILIAATDAYLNSGKAATVNASDIYEKVVKGGDTGYFLLSIQKPEDYAKGHVPGAVNIPFNAIAKEENLKKLPKDKKIVVICYTGHTASYTSMLLNQLGYDATVLKFGTMGWNDTTAGMGTVKPFPGSLNYPVVTEVNPNPAKNSLPITASCFFISGSSAGD